MKHFESVAATAFGLVFLVLAVAVAIETGARKLLNVSLQGVDELGGYCLAIGGALAFAVSLVSRAHIRIDIVHEYLPRVLRAGLNLLAVLALFVCALVLLYLAWVSLSELDPVRLDGADPVGDAAAASAVALGRGARGVRPAGNGAGRARSRAGGGWAARCPRPRVRSARQQGGARRGAPGHRAARRRRGHRPGREREKHEARWAVGAVGFVLMVGLMLIGLPIAAVMLLLGLFGGMIAFGDAFLASASSVLWGTMSENNLTAIPLFVLLGELLLRSGMADRMYVAFATWLGRLPGGLLHTNIGCCALFAATSGSSVATAATIGTVALPSQYRQGYAMPAALGSIAAGGTLGIMIPPSVNMIIYGSMTNQSVGKLFIAGIVPD